MIHSMTAYGRTEDKKNDNSIACEIRTINHRYLEISIRMPEELRSLEQKIRENISRKLKRGKIDCNIRIDKNTSKNDPLLINQDVLKKVIDAAENTSINLSNPSALSALDLIQWPGVLEKDSLEPTKINKSILKLLGQTLDVVIDTRKREGEKIKKMLVQRCSKIKKIVSNTQKKIPMIQKKLREKLKKRAKELVNELDNDRLEQELLFISQKMDIAEEIDRLLAHTEEVERVLDQSGPIGRRLDFLMQEMNRESNTLGSKSNHLHTSNASVELKVLIEQMREQIQNIE
ncbi:MAG: YicC family protein [Legionellales bacterium]|nr:YicC family protein [Legionellales bacterium]|tara:strand:+ start:404 stop:1270 length:867 start_codon:yes stop_codon:yes gene_type:complete